MVTGTAAMGFGDDDIRVASLGRRRDLGACRSLCLTAAQRLSWPAAGIVSQLARRWCFSIRSRFSTHSSAVGRKNGGPYWIRTSDFDDVNIALYQLS